MTALLEVKDLRTSFKLESGGEFSPVDGVSFSVHAGRTLGARWALWANPDAARA